MKKLRYVLLLGLVGFFARAAQAAPVSNLWLVIDSTPAIAGADIYSTVTSSRAVTESRVSKADASGKTIHKYYVPGGHGSYTVKAIAGNLRSGRKGEFDIFGASVTAIPVRMKYK